MKTQRLNLMIAPEEKAAITRRAEALGLSTSEFVRRAVTAYDPDRDDAELHALARAFLASVKHAEKALDAAIARLDGFEERLEKARAQGRAEARTCGERWPFPLPGQTEVAR